VRVFVAGATGVIGIRLVPLLTAAGHTVAGMTRSPAKIAALEALGAEPVVCDVYDLGALTTAVDAFRPQTIIHQLTDLPDDAHDLPGRTAGNARIRREGTRNLLTAAERSGATGFLAQSVAWELPGDSEAAKTEMERAVLRFGGVVIRYGQFYGPGTYYETDPPGHPRIHIDEAARRTLQALHLPATTIVITEDDAARETGW
jgi:nucleoside-diphosphate-sugar epimerase